MTAVFPGLGLAWAASTFLAVRVILRKDALWPLKPSKVNDV